MWRVGCGVWGGSVRKEGAREGAREAGERVGGVWVSVRSVRGGWVGGGIEGGRMMGFFSFSCLFAVG